MPSTVDVARGLLGFLGPLTGDRATGKVLVVPPAGTAGTLVLGPNWWLYPVINGAMRSDFPYRVLPNYAAEDGAWDIPLGGALVDVESHVGGTRWNLEAGTIMRWADEIPTFFGVDGLQVGPDGITGGTDDPDPAIGSDLLKWVGFAEQLAPADVGLDLFRSTIGAFPAALIFWESTQSVSTFVGRGKQIYDERFSLCVITDRADDSPARRGEGLRLLDAAQDLILWQQIYGDPFQKGFGIVVSAKHGTNIEGRFRLQLKGEEYQQFAIYGIRLRVGRLATSVYTTRSADWKKTRIQAPTPETNFPSDDAQLERADVSTNMNPDE